MSKLKNIAIVSYSFYFQIALWLGREEVVSRHFDAWRIESDVYGASGCGGQEIERCRKLTWSGRTQSEFVLPMFAPTPFRRGLEGLNTHIVWVWNT